MALTWARNGIWALLLLLVGGAVSYALLVGKPRPGPETPPAYAPPVVDVVVAAPARQALSVETQGTVRPLREIKLVSQVGGRVEAVSQRFAVGGFFSAGEQLLKVEDIDYRFAIARAESQVAAARQRLAEERGRALQAKREWRDLGSDEANALFLRKPQIAAAEAALRASEADLADAELDLKRTAISAPFNGRISAKQVDIGQYVAPGAVVASVYDTDVAQVRLPLTGRQVALLDLPLDYQDSHPGDAGGAEVVLRALFANRLWEWQGRIVRTDASIDENSRVVYAVAEIDKPFSREEGSDRPPLSPGLFVNATISGRELPEVTLLPRSALLRSGTVMVVDARQRVREQQVQVLQSDSTQLWVQGLQRGERVIAREPGLAVAGTEVVVNTVAGLAGGGN
ncbi:MAG: efflux RND transporter periplasmic adaptor subunit [Haliea sp.]|jgi:RND family efflux transporter MFP subunit|nr:efflux RND transporter periplasmic adaptor subunit [Haliea sp.]